MVSRVTLDIDLCKPLSTYGDGRLIAYDDKRKKYYVTTKEEFLKEQNEEIEKLVEGMKQLEKKCVQYAKDCDDKYNEFLKTYKETNGKLIEMVKSVVVEEK